MKLSKAQQDVFQGIRVDDDTVIIKVKGGNDAARWLCGELLAMFSADHDTTQRETHNAGLGCTIVPIRPTIGMSKLEQLRAFVAWEQENNPEKKHIAAWALFEIERLRAAISETLDENGHLADGDNCTLIKLKMVMPNVKLTSGALDAPETE